MSKILKPLVIAAMLASGASMAPASAQVRVKPVIAPTGPVKPGKVPVKPATEPVKQATVAKVKPLTQAELQARIKPAPSYLSMSDLKGKIPASTAAGAIPDLKAAFSLTPAVQSVPGRGSIKIEGQITLPTPVPPGFPGQAVVQYGPLYSNPDKMHGGVWISLDAQKDLFYIVDCVAAIHQGNTSVVYQVSGADSPQSGTLAITNGHLVFTVRRTSNAGDINIFFRPEDEAKFQTWGSGGYVLNRMDFWGCQISTGG